MTTFFPVSVLNFADLEAKVEIGLGKILRFLFWTNRSWQQPCKPAFAKKIFLTVCGSLSRSAPSFVNSKINHAYYQLIFYLKLFKNSLF